MFNLRATAASQLRLVICIASCVLAAMTTTTKSRRANTVPMRSSNEGLLQQREGFYDSATPSRRVAELESVDEVIARRKQGSKGRWDELPDASPSRNSASGKQQVPAHGDGTDAKVITSTSTSTSDTTQTKLSFVDGLQRMLSAPHSPDRASSHIDGSALNSETLPSHDLVRLERDGTTVNSDAGTDDDPQQAGSKASSPMIASTAALPPQPTPLHLALVGIFEEELHEDEGYQAPPQPPTTNKEPFSASSASSSSDEETSDGSALWSTETLASSSAFATPEPIVMASPMAGFVAAGPLGEASSAAPTIGTVWTLAPLSPASMSTDVRQQPTPDPAQSYLVPSSPPSPGPTGTTLPTPSSRPAAVPTPLAPTEATLPTSDVAQTPAPPLVAWTPSPVSPSDLVYGSSSQVNPTPGGMPWTPSPQSGTVYPEHSPTEESSSSSNSSVSGGGNSGTEQGGKDSEEREITLAPSPAASLVPDSPLPPIAPEQISTPVPTLGGTGGEILSTLPTGPPRTPSPMEGGASPTPSPAAQTSAPLARTAGDQEITSLAPAAASRSPEGPQPHTVASDSSSSDSTGAGGRTAMPADGSETSFADRYFTFGDSDSSASAPNPTSPTGPPVSVGVPIPGPILDRGREEEDDEGEVDSEEEEEVNGKEEEEEEEEEGSKPTAFPDVFDTSPAPTGFLEGAPMSSSPSTSTRAAVDSTYAPTWSPSPTMTYEHGNIDNQGMTASPSSSGVTSSPTPRSTRWDNQGFEMSSAPSPYPHLVSPVSTAAPTATLPGANDRGGDVSSAPSFYPSFSMADFTAPPTMSSTGGNGEGEASSSAPSSINDTIDAELTSSPTTSSTRGEDQGDEGSFAPSSSPDLISSLVTAMPTPTSTPGNSRGHYSTPAPSFPAPDPRTTAPDPSTLTFTPSPTTNSSGETSRGGEISPAPSPPPDSGALDLTASPTIGSTEVSSRGGFSSSAPSPSPDTSSLALTSSPTTGSTRGSNGGGDISSASSSAPDSSPFPSTSSPTMGTTAGSDGHSELSSAPSSTAPDSGNLAFTASPTVSASRESNQVGDSSSAPSSLPDSSSALLSPSPTTSSTRESLGGGDVSFAPSSSPYPTPLAVTASPTFTSTPGSAWGDKSSSAPSSPPPHPATMAFTSSPTAGSSGEIYRGRDMSSAPSSSPDFGTFDPTASPTTSPRGASSRSDFLSFAPSSFIPTTPELDYDETFSPSTVVDDPRTTTSSPTSSPTERPNPRQGASSIYSTSPSSMDSASSGNTANPAFSGTEAPSGGVRGAGPAPTLAPTMDPTTASMDRGEGSLSPGSPTTSPTMSMTGWTTVPAVTYAPSAIGGRRAPGDSNGTLGPTISPLSLEGNPEDVLPTISPSSTSTGGDFLRTDFPSPGPTIAPFSSSSSPTAREGGGTAGGTVATAAPTSAPTIHDHVGGQPLQPTFTPTGSPSYQEHMGGVEANLSPAPSGALESSWTSSFFWPGDRSPSPTTVPVERIPGFVQTTSPTLSMFETESPTTGRSESGSQETNQPSPSTSWPMFSSSSASLRPSLLPTASSTAFPTSPSSSLTNPSMLWPTASPSASSASPSEGFSTQRGQPSSAPTLFPEEQHPARSSTPTTMWSPSPSSSGSSFHWGTASPTVAPSDISSASASPTAFDGEHGGEGSKAEEEQPTPVPTLVPAPAPDQTKAPSASRSPSSSDGDRGGEELAPTIAPTGFEISREAETPMPSVSFLTLMPTGRSYSSEGKEEPVSGSSDDDDGNGENTGRETFAPSEAPVPAIDSDGGVDRGDSETTTPAPSSHGENTWAWWYQTGGERADRGNALVHGVGENDHHRYLVGTEDGVVADDEGNVTTSTATGVGMASRPRRQRRELQSDTGSGQDISAICLTTDGSELWRHTGGSEGEDVALCIDASEDHVVIAGYTTGDLYSETYGGDDVFLGLLDADDGNLVAGWQFGGEGSERAYAVGLDEESGDVIVGGYTTSSLFAPNADGLSQYFVVRLDKSELLLNSLGLIDLTEEDGAAVVWGWQYARSSTDPEAVVSLRVMSDIGLVAALGARGLPPEWSPRDTDFVPGFGTESLLWSSVLSLDLDTGGLLWNSDEAEGLGTAVAVDASSGDAYVAGYSVASSSSSSSSSPEEDDFERIVVYKVEASTGDKVWSYEPTAGPVSNGRALAIEMIGRHDVVVAGITSGSDTYPSEGGTDAFTLVLAGGSGSETCYNQVGTESVDVVSGISVDNSDSTIYPDMAIVGYTGGSLAGPNAGGTDIFAIGMELETFCPDVQRSTSSAAEAETQGSIAAGTVSIMAGFAIAGAVVSTMVAPAATLASVAAAAGGANTSGGVAATVSTTAATGAAAGAVVTSASAAPASLGGAGAVVTILSAGGGAGGLMGSAPPPGVATYRSPSASIGLLVMMQLQFLATLSLVSSVHDSTSVLSSFVQDLRWVNLWLPIPADLSPASSDCEEADDDALMTEEVFYGNTALVLGLLVAIFVVHVAVVSIVEAYWLAQDRAMAAVKAARQAYGMSATDFDPQQSQGTGRRSLSHGRRRFSAIANMPSDDDLISFGEDSQHGDDVRPRSPSPAPASSVGPARPDSPPSVLLDGHPNRSPACRTWDCGCDDGRPQEDTPNNGGDKVDDVDDSSFSVWASGHQEPQQRGQNQQQAATRSLPGSPMTRSEGAATFFTGDRSSSNHSPTTNKTSKSPRAGTLTPAARSSLERRVSDRGGRSLPGSPTRGGRRYGGTDEFYPHQSTVSSVRSASPSSLHWDSPPRGFASGTTPSRSLRPFSRVQEERSTATGGSKKNDGDNDGSEGDGDDFVDLFYMERFLSGKADAASADGYRGGGRRPPALPQQTPTGAVACGSRFDLSTYGAGSAGRSDLGGDNGGLRRRRVNNVDGLQEDADDQSSDTATDTGGSAAYHDNHPILACRRRSRSVWLHFPHLELLFLFWAFEGAVAAQVSALMNAGCSRVFWLALAALLLFPVLMFVMVWRTIAVRVRPNDLLVFRVNETDDRQEGNGGGTGEEQENNDEPPGEPAQAEDGEALPPGTSDVDGTQPRQGLWNKFVSLWSDRGMLFSWADTGSWESVATHDEDVKREADWFRIGFEPLFIDLSKLGCYYLIFLMIKWFGIACVGVLVEDSVKKLLYMLVLHAVDLAVLVRGSPFANSVVNAMNAMLTAVDCASSALMLGAAGFDEDETSTFNDIAFLLQLVALIALVIPVYIDTGVALAIFSVEKLSQKCGSRDSGYDLLQTREAEDIEDEQRREYVRRFARRSWPSFWCSMVRHNVLACFDDIRDGVCTPGSSLTRRRRRRQLRRENRKLVRTARRGCLFQVRCCGNPFQLRCCGIKAAPTVPIPASLPTSCVSRDERANNHRCFMYGGDGSLRKTTQQRQQQQQRHGTWTLPPKLRAVGRAAGSWGGETALMSSRSTGLRRPPSPTGSGHRGVGGGGQHHRRRGSALSMAGWSTNDRDQSWGHGRSNSRGGVWGLGEAGRGLGEGASGCGLIPSVFCPTPIPVDEPRRKSFHVMSGSVDLLRESDGHGGRTESFGSRRGSGREGGGEGQAGASVTRRTPSMFSTAPVATKEPRRKANITGHFHASEGGIGCRRVVTAGGSEARADEEAANSVGLLASAPLDRRMATDEPRRPAILDMRSSGQLGRFGEGEKKKSDRNGGASGRGLISDSSLGPISDPQKTPNAWRGLAVSVSSTEGDEGEDRVGEAANKGSPARDGGG